MNPIAFSFPRLPVRTSQFGTPVKPSVEEHPHIANFPQGFQPIFFGAGKSSSDSANNKKKLSTQLFSIIRMEHPEERLRANVQNGANMEITDSEGYTPLLRAVENRRYQAVKTLLELGAKVNARNHNGENALYLLGDYQPTLFEENIETLLRKNGATIQRTYNQLATQREVYTKDDIQSLQQLKEQYPKIYVNAYVKPHLDYLAQLRFPKGDYMPTEKAFLEAAKTEYPYAYRRYVSTRLTALSKISPDELYDAEKAFLGSTKAQNPTAYYEHYYQEVCQSIIALMLDMKSEKLLSRPYKHYLESVQNAYPRIILLGQAATGDEDAYLKLLPSLLLNPDPEFQTYFNVLMTFIDDNYYLDGFHPNDAETMLLLGRPFNTPAEIRQTSLALTSPYGFQYHGVDTLKGNILLTLQKVGFFSHSLKFWRFDTIRGNDGNTLFSEYGFKPITGREETTDKIFGKGFLLTPETCLWARTYLKPGTIIEFRQGYLLISQPENGTLVIRNSSKIFGRDKLKNPAYWSPKALTVNDLRTFDPRENPRFRHILEPDLYLQTDLNFRPKLETLVNGLEAFKDNYARWKFDSARPPVDGQFVGYKTPGFLPTMRFLYNEWKTLNILSLIKPDEAAKRKGKTPELAFVNPRYPIYEPYSYEGSDGQSHRTYAYNDAHLRELARIFDPSNPQSDMANTDLTRFLQMGLQNQGELVLVAPDQSKS